MATSSKLKQRKRSASRVSLGRILVASAGDAESAGALRIAAEIAQRGDTLVLALGVASRFPRSAGAVAGVRQPLSPNEEQRRAVLEDLRRSVGELAGLAAWTTRAVVGMPAEAIIDVASQWNASMIVLGIGKHSRLDRLLSRETSVAVMRRARVPVLAVPARARRLPARAVAAIDFTAASHAAALYAAGLLAPDATLYAAHVCAFGDAPAKPGGLVDLYRAGAKTKLADVVDDLRRQTSCQVEPVMLDGDPGGALIKFGRQARVDLFALGGHELGLMDRLLLGSVRTHVVREARCSVLIAPP